MIGLIFFGIVLFLFQNARSKASLEKIEIDKQEEKKEEIRMMSRWLEAFVGYYELGNMNEFFGEMRIGESDTPIENVYIALEEVGAGAIVPPLRTAAYACIQFHEKVDELDHENDAEVVRVAESEYRRVTNQSDMEIKKLGISVYDLLNEFRAKNIEIFQ
ncbi:hypothetical protein [Sphingopyxis sp. H115]|uniref:hypothetical protein n=1 Tax=Sphingopyxis sp. H115 TaxID=1759073 RepID=UPI001F37D379|nr:hypothetical protein [Sphingopyxis sp. H115]